MKQIAPSELILNDDGSIYHLNLRPEELAHTIITVGDPDRVAAVSKHFDNIELQKQKREFCTHTGTLNGKRLTVISTGIGTDNIDIVFNELDALVNIDFEKRQIKEELISLDIIRIGTSGSMQADVDVDTFLASDFAIGLDGLLNMYVHQNSELETNILQALPPLNMGIQPYIATASESLLQKIAFDITKGITATCLGFYGPQARELRLKPSVPNFLDKLSAFGYENYRLTNFEMETAGIYGMSKMLGHQALSMNAILANRQNKTFSKTPKQSTERLIQLVLERLCQ